MLLEAKQNKLQQQHHQLPNGHATFTGSGCNTSNSNSNTNNIKIPPRPPIRSVTTITSSLSAAQQQQQHHHLELNETSSSPSALCASQLNSIVTKANTLSNESPNIKFVLTHASAHNKQQLQQLQQQAIPQAAMDEMRV